MGLLVEVILFFFLLLNNVSLAFYQFFFLLSSICHTMMQPNIAVVPSGCRPLVIRIFFWGFSHQIHRLACLHVHHCFHHRLSMQVSKTNYPSFCRSFNPKYQGEYILQYKIPIICTFTVKFYRQKLSTRQTHTNQASEKESRHVHACAVVAGAPEQQCQQQLMAAGKQQEWWQQEHQLLQQ